MVTEKGCVIGVWIHLAETPTAFAENIRALVDIVGIDHAAIGTDTKMTPAYRSPTEQNQQLRDKRPNENSDKNDQSRPPQNEKRDNKKQGGELTNTVWETQKNGFYFTVVEALLKTGFNEKEIAKIGGGNYFRIFDEATRLRN